MGRAGTEKSSELLKWFEVEKFAENAKAVWPDPSSVFLAICGPMGRSVIIW
jgi:hypothetical protein